MPNNLKVLGARIPKGLNRTTKISSGSLCVREENISKKKIKKTNKKTNKKRKNKKKKPQKNKKKHKFILQSLLTVDLNCIKNIIEEIQHNEVRL